jgi:hypothetical protein
MAALFTSIFLGEGTRHWLRRPADQGASAEGGEANGNHCVCSGIALIEWGSPLISAKFQGTVVVQWVKSSALVTRARRQRRGGWVGFTIRALPA